MRHHRIGLAWVLLVGIIVCQHIQVVAMTATTEVQPEGELRTQMKPDHQPLRIHLDPTYTIAAIDPRIHGGFLEHAGRVIYESIYAPGHPAADEHGLRQDTLAVLKELGVPIYRYPGGNFVSGYNWLDGVGPRDQRPRRFDQAWRQIETNQFGTDDFMVLMEQLESQPMLAVNLGTGNEAEAAALVEYCNAPVGTKYSDLRASHGHPEPYGVHLWCLGNEMDGPWQTGHLNAEEYAGKAARAAQMMKQMDPTIELVACGSVMGDLHFDETVASRLIGKAEYLSAHYYRENNREDDATYLRVSEDLEKLLGRLRTICELARLRNSGRGQLQVCFDEWGARLIPEWQQRTPDGQPVERQVAPPLCEWPIYWIDALVDAQFLNAFVRNADLVRVANFAMNVNWFAPVLVNEDQVLRQTAFHVLQLYRQYAQGVSLDVRLLLEQTEQGSPQWCRPGLQGTGTVDVSACYQPDQNTIGVFMVNRDLKESREVCMEVCGQAFVSVRRAISLSHGDPYAANTFDRPDRVLPVALDVSSMRPEAVSLAPLSLLYLELELR